MSFCEWKQIGLFSLMADLSANWQILRRPIPAGRNAAIDGAEQKFEYILFVKFEIE